MTDNTQPPTSAEEQLANLIKNSKNPFLDPWSILGIHKINLEIFSATAHAGLEASNLIAKFHLANMQSDLKQSRDVASAGQSQASLKEIAEAQRDILARAVQARYDDHAEFAKQAEALNLQAVQNLDTSHDRMTEWYDSISKPPPTAAKTTRKRK
jgi:hypothetical protein